MSEIEDVNYNISTKTELSGNNDGTDNKIILESEGINEGLNEEEKDTFDVASIKKSNLSSPKHSLFRALSTLSSSFNDNTDEYANLDKSKEKELIELDQIVVQAEAEAIAVDMQLKKLNPYFATKLQEQQQLLCFIVKSNGESDYESFSIRTLLQYIASAIKYSINDNNNTANQSNNNKNSSSQIPSLQARDLRRLDAYFGSDQDDDGHFMPAILVRKHCVLLVFDPLRTIILADRMILLVPDGGADSLISVLSDHLTTFVDKQRTIGEKTKYKDVPETRDSITESLIRTLNPEQLNFDLEKKKNISTKNYSDLNEVIEDLEEQDFNGISFEYRVYEAIFATVLALQTREYNYFKTQVQNCLGHFKSASIVSLQIQETMRLLKNKVNIIRGKIKSYRESLNQLAEDAESLAFMNLYKLSCNPQLYNTQINVEEVDELEILVDSFLSDYYTLESKLEFLRKQIQNEEDLVSLRLDTSRNLLLIADTIIGVISCMFGLGSMIAGIFGMNLNMGNLVNDKVAFWYVTWGCLIGVFACSVVILIGLRLAGVLPGKNHGTINDYLSFRSITTKLSDLAHYKNKIK